MNRAASSSCISRLLPRQSVVFCLARLFEMEILGFWGQLSLAPCWLSEWLRLLDVSKQLVSDHDCQALEGYRLSVAK
jgi:hypothetical protein